MYEIDKIYCMQYEDRKEPMKNKLGKNPTFWINEQWIFTTTFIKRKKPKSETTFKIISTFCNTT